ncbi:hypothetical protein [Halococcus sp. IIIV-5B]|uniref:hypothetical protein n=1 Tax=Halococcus sp. IIIV-5B TaxID=2321230 RepID=UPI000E74FB8F|nr:hypothetical protein [Halococcus sp. IIIV-5B]RJS98444.1 hypothetical protein D3261_16840 [Halococcus sp. IIIV-5B]
MVRSLDDLDVDDDALIVECTECGTAWVFEPHSEPAYDFDPSEHGHPDYKAERPVPAERYLRGHEWVIDHENSVQRDTYNSKSQAENAIASVEMFPWCFFESDYTEPWLREVDPGLPPLRGYYISEDDIDGDELNRLGRKVARAVFDLTPRTVTHIELDAMPGFETTDPEAFERLKTETGLGFERHGFRGTWLEGTVDASEAVLDAVLRLFGGGLISAVFYDDDGRELFARYDNSQMTFSLESELVDDLFSQLSSDEVNQIERFGWG